MYHVVPSHGKRLNHYEVITDFVKSFLLPLLPLPLLPPVFYRYHFIFLCKKGLFQTKKYSKLKSIEKISDEKGCFTKSESFL